MPDDLLLRQLREVSRETLPDLDWIDHKQGAEARFDGLKLTLIAGGGGSGNSFVWLGLRPQDSRSFVYHRELCRGRGLTGAQGGRILAMDGDPLDFLGACLREAFELAAELTVFSQNENTS